MMTQENIGKFIAEKRKENNMTQEQFAEKLGVSNRSVSRWENGKTMPDYSLFPSICETLRVSVSELLEGKYTEKNDSLKNKIHLIIELLDYAHNKRKARQKTSSRRASSAPNLTLFWKSKKL